MTKGFQNLVNALESRFDYQSSRVLAREALAKAGLKEEATYSEADLQRFADGLSTVAKRLDRVWAALGVAPSGQPLPKIDVPTLTKLEAPPAPPVSEVAPTVTVDEVAVEASQAIAEEAPAVTVEEVVAETQAEELPIQAELEAELESEGEQEESEEEDSGEQQNSGGNNHNHFHNKKKNKNKHK